MAGAVPLVVTGDPNERLASLFDLHYDRLYRLARRLAVSPDDALDLVQETFLRTARFSGGIPVGAKQEEAWLVRVLINIQRDQWRKKSVRERYGKASVSGNQGPEQALVARAAIWQALNVLSPRRRSIVILYELEALPIPEIASLLGIHPITVRWHLSMGRRQLAHVLKSHPGGSNENS